MRRKGSEGQVALLGIAQDGVDDVAVASQDETQLIIVSEYGAGVPADGRMVGRGWGIDQGVLDA